MQPSMNLGVLRILAHSSKQNKHLLPRPAECAGEKSQGEGFQAIQKLDKFPRPNVLHVRVFRPRANGDSERLVMDVDQPGVVAHKAFQPKHLAGIHEQVRPAQELGALDRAVV